MKNLKKIIIGLFVFIFIVLIVYMFLHKPNLKPVRGQIASLDLNNYNKLMIVSHPGDESVWGGVHLLSDNYLVVCVSCGYDKNKEAEFLEATKFSNDKAIMLGYSDKVYFNYKRIKKQLKYILNYKDWQEVITHNPDGEYGNYQHKQINKMLQELNVKNLYYFGKYYDVKELNKLDKETTLNGNYIKQKIKNMVQKYDGLYDDYKHILPFEDWVRDSEWKS